MCLHQVPVNGSPQLHLRKLTSGAAGNFRNKKDNIAIPQPDEDVLELEHLKQKTIFDNAENSGEIDSDISDDTTNIGSGTLDNTFEESVNSEDPLPILEKQLELEAGKINTNNNKNDDDTIINNGGINIPGQPEREEEIIIQHRPPHLPSFAKPQQPQQHLKNPIDTAETNNGQQTNNEQFNQEIHELNEKSPSPAKSFYGAARLAFGQNPEIVQPTQSTTTTSTTTHTVNIVASTTPNPDDDDSVIIPENYSNLSSSTGDIMSAVVDEAGASITTATAKNIPYHQNYNNNKDIVEDIFVSELEATKGNVERRSVERTLPKTAETLLKRAESSFDMAQYVFWTGDESGVARAVEEYIEQGLMSRENALKFLREIRMGVDYLQQSYDHRVFAEQKGNDFKKNDNDDLPKTDTHHQSKRVVENNFMELQEKHLPKLQQHHHQHVQQHPTLQKLENQPIKSNLQKTFDEIPTLLRLREITNEQRKENINNDEDDMAGRARLADFVYTEYTLEEVIYQLAKVMFAQSLTHDSGQSQKALQRLTSFLETEGELGRISPSLQKKILDVLLAALSDTLANHPELLATARANLGKTFHQIQDNSFESIMKH